MRNNEGTVRVTEEEARLNAEIQEMEAKIKELYAAVGEACFEARGNEEPPADKMQEYFQSIQNCKDQIQELEKQIKLINGITSCPYCGAEVFVEDAYCCACGRRIKTEISVSSADEKCPNCGHLIVPGQLYCRGCGLKFARNGDAGERQPQEQNARPAPETEPDAAAQPAEEPETIPPESVKEKICPNCGAAVDPNDLFCIKCGTRL